MSDPSFWRDVCTLNKRTSVGIDPTTHLPKFEDEEEFKELACDLSIFRRRKAVEGPSGTRYTMVDVHQLKLWPEEVSECPDEDDDIIVNGDHYKVQTVEHSFDGGSNAYRGSKLTLEAVERT
jgi:hypothetical protein